MNLFYLDTEYSNGNFYLGDIFDLSLIAAKSGNVFHTLINIPLPLDNYIKFMCNITDSKLWREGVSFEEAYKSMIAFINFEVEETENEKEEEDIAEVTIMAHNGYLADFPLLLVNCYKNKCDTTAMSNYRFVDTLQMLQKEAENETPVFSIETVNNNNIPHSLSLKSLANQVLRNTDQRPLHNSYTDAQTLMQVFTHESYRSILMNNINNKTNTYNVNVIQDYLDVKLPVSIDTMMYNLATNVESPHELTLLLSAHVREKTSMNKKSVSNIAMYYYLCCKQR